MWHRGYVAVARGVMDCPYTFMHDMVAGNFRWPWENTVAVTDGTTCGFAPPQRAYQGAEANPVMSQPPVLPTSPPRPA